MLSKFIWKKDRRILVSGQGSEDAVVLDFPQQRAMVQSVDFLTPIVNDPYAFGCIAAANALSDIYAMGADPFSAMNIVCFPKDCLSLDILTDILRGGQETVLSSGAVMAGGHTVEDPELKYGLAVTGEVDASKVSVNGGAQAHDLLILTKPIGTGVLATAVKAEWENAPELERTLFAWAGRLNATGARVIKDHSLRGATDITGFGLGGHALEMAKAAGVHIRLFARSVPLLAHAQELASMGLVPAGAHANAQYCQGFFDIQNEVDAVLRDLIFDPQTSGGLLLAVPEAKLAGVQRDLRSHGDTAQVVGEVLSGAEHGIGVSLIDA